MSGSWRLLFADPKTPKGRLSRPFVRRVLVWRSRVVALENFYA